MSYWGWLTTWSRTCAGPWPTTGWIGGCGSTWRPSCSSSTSSASGPTTEWRCWATRSSPRPSWTGCCTTATSSTSEARATGLAGTATPAGPEILALALDPANIGPAGRFWDCLYQAADVLGSFDRLGVIRADASWGTGRRHSGTRGPGTHLYRQGLLQSHRAPLRSPRSPHAVGVPGPLHSNLVTGGPTASPIAVISCPWCSLS